MMPLPSLAPLLIAAAIGAGCGYAVAAKLGATQTAQAREALARCEAAAALLARAQEAEAAAARRLAAQQSAYENRLKEVRSEIYRLAAGRECLSGALRLRLNAAIAADHMSQGAAEPDPAHAAAASDPIIPSTSGRGAGGEGATDADVAAWAIDAARLYDACRARIDAIRQWDEVTFDGR